IIEIDEPVSFSGVQVDWKEGRHKVFAMGDRWIRQSNQRGTTYQSLFIPIPSPTADTIYSLTSDWVSKQVKDAGGKYPQGLYDLRNRVKRQEIKVSQLTGGDEKMKKGGEVLFYEVGGGEEDMWLKLKKGGNIKVKETTKYYKVEYKSLAKFTEFLNELKPFVTSAKVFIAGIGDAYLILKGYYDDSAYSKEEDDYHSIVSRHFGFRYSTLNSKPNPQKNWNGEWKSLDDTIKYISVIN
ncbi:MAG: hypothetical protein AABY22_17310, partial [Nanoarchaeota archaeon]